MLRLAPRETASIIVNKDEHEIYSQLCALSCHGIEEKMSFKLNYLASEIICRIITSQLLQRFTSKRI